MVHRKPTPSVVTTPPSPPARSNIAQPSSGTARLAGVPWGNSGQTSLLKQGLSSASAQRQQLAVNTRGSYVPPRGSQTGLLASEFSQMNLQAPNVKIPNRPRVYDPSNAPGRSEMTRMSQQSQVTTMTRVARQVKNDICFLSGLTKKNFLPGEIISLPFHQPNLNPTVDPNDENLTKTKKQGPVYSKRRMVVVLWIYEEILFCVPLYTWHGRGASSRPNHLLPEYVSMKNASDEDFVNLGEYPPVEARLRYPTEATSTVHITGAIPVRCEENILRCGRVTEGGFSHLLELWNDLYMKAKRQRYDERAR